MTIHPPARSTRAVSLLLFAAFAGVALWLFVPWDRSGSGFGGGGDAALPPSVRLGGPVQVETQDGFVTRLIVPLELRGEEGIALTDGGRVRAETSLSESAAAAVPATYTVTWLDGNGDETLDPGEHALLTVDLPERSGVRPENELRLVVHPGTSTPLVIEDVLP